MNLLLYSAFVLAPQTTVELERRLPEIRDYWIGLDLLDEDNTNRFRFLFQLEDDLIEMEYRRETVRADCPPSLRTRELPSRDTAYQYVFLQNDFLRWAKMQRPFLAPNQQTQLDLIVDDCELRNTVWYMILNCQQPDFHGRRVYLQELRDLVGAEDFDRGLIPHPLPLAVTNSGWAVPK